MGALDSERAKTTKREQWISSELDALGGQRSAAINTGSPEDVQRLTREIERREMEYRRVREQIQQLDKREGELLNKGVQQGRNLPAGDDFNAKLQKLQDEADKLKGKFSLDIKTDPAKRPIAQITQQFDREMEQIREKFDGAQESGLLALADQAKQAKIDKVLQDELDRKDKGNGKLARADAKRDTNARFVQRGTSEAFSAVLKASRATGSENQFLAAIAKATAESAKANKIVAAESKKKNQPKPGATVEVAVVGDLD